MNQIAKSVLGDIMSLTLSDHYDPSALGVPNTTVPEALARLFARNLLDRTRFSERMDSEETTLALAALRRNSWGALTAIRVDDANAFVYYCASMASILELTQHCWSTETDVSDAASLLSQCFLHYDHLRELIRPVKASLISGDVAGAQAPAVSSWAIIPARIDLLRAIYLLGLNRRLERDRPSHNTVSTKWAFH